MTIVYKHPILGYRATGPTIKEELFKKKLEEKAIEYKVVKKLPSLKQLEKWANDGVCPTPDGCRVEPDGHCQHVWLLIMGVI